MDKFEGVLRQGVRLRMMISLCVLLCIVYVACMGAFTFNEERNVRADSLAAYEDELSTFMFFDANWDDWVASSGEAAVEAAYGKRPERPVEPGVQYSVYFEGFSHIFLVVMGTAFLCFIMSSLAHLSVGMHYLLKELDDAINDPDAATLCDSDESSESVTGGEA